MKEAKKYEGNRKDYMRRQPVKAELRDNPKEAEKAG
jgi:hypothetical protein